MKKRFILLFSFLAVVVACHQPKRGSRISVTDDGNTYTIDIRARQGDKTVAFNQNYNVSGMTKPQKESIKQRVLDSLHLTDTKDVKY